MKFAFATCVQLGLSCIDEIYNIGGKLDLLITLLDNKAVNKSGRVYLDKFARENKIELFKTSNINDREVIEAIQKNNIDWLFIIGWSQIAKAELLKTPKNGCIGMHPTLLPVGRGRAAIPWTIIKGLAETGVTMFKLDEGIDTGDILAQEKIKVMHNEDATTLYEKVNLAHIKLIRDMWSSIVSDNLVLKKQDETKATCWEERKPKDGEIFACMTMAEADRIVRAVTHPYPGAFYKTDGKTYRIWSAISSKVEGLIKLRDGYLSPTDFEIEN